MLTAYISGALRQATYKLLDDGTFWGEIPGFQGVWATGTTLEACREELQEVLEGWIILGLRLGHALPVVDGLNLTPPLEPVDEGGERDERDDVPSPTAPSHEVPA